MEKETVYTVIGIGDFESHCDLIEKDPGMIVQDKRTKGENIFIRYRLKDQLDKDFVVRYKNGRKIWATTAT
jgi:hypothetical protein